MLGRLDTADEDCRRLYAARRPDLGFLCQSTTLTLTPEAPAVYARLEGVLSRTDLLDGSLRSYGLGLLGEIAALQGDRDLARAHLAAALAEEPEALRIRMMLADLCSRAAATTPPSTCWSERRTSTGSCCAAPSPPNASAGSRSSTPPGRSCRAGSARTSISD